MVLFLINYLKPKYGGILINTSPTASVYINGKLTGKTPYTNILNGKEITVRLVPDDATGSFLAYETKVKLAPGMQTVIQRSFASSDEFSSGENLEFINIDSNTAKLSVNTYPPGAQIIVNGVSKGFSPFNILDLPPGASLLTLKLAGYLEKTLTINTQKKYQLMLSVKLAKAPEATPTPLPELPKKMVSILKTPTGLLRVRTEPGLKGEEIAQVTVGEEYEYLDTDVATGWVKIQYRKKAAGLPNGIEGWVSGEYVKIL